MSLNSTAPSFGELARQNRPAHKHLVEERQMMATRQVKILEMLALGYKYPQIAAELKLTVHATRMTAFRLYEKLGAETQAHAVAIAYTRGILKP